MKRKEKKISIALISSLVIIPIVFVAVNNKNKIYDSESSINYNASKNSKITNEEIADQIIINNRDAVISKNVNEISELLRTQLITDAILKELSISIPEGAIASKISFDRLQTNDLFKISFTIYYDGVAKSGVDDFLNATPTDQDIANKIKVENPNALEDKDAIFIEGLLNKEPMEKDILNLLSVFVPIGADFTKVSFTNIKKDVFKISFTIQYNKVSKEVNDFLNLKPSNQQIADSLIITNNNALNNSEVKMNNIEIGDMLEGRITNQILDKLSIKINNSIVANKISFNIVNSNLFKVSFIISYDGVEKAGEEDFLNAYADDLNVANTITVTKPSILINETMENVDKLLRISPITVEVLNRLSISIPEGSDINKISITEIDITNPIKIVFKISYNNVTKTNFDYLNVSVTDLQIANSIVVIDENFLISKSVLEIRKLLRSNPMTQEILDQLSISIPDGSSPSMVSIDSININNLFKITFKIKYNKISKNDINFLNATPTDQDIANTIVVDNTNILNHMTGREVEELLKTPITEKLLSDLTIIIPDGIDFTKITFTDIENIIDPFKVTFIINYNNVPKSTGPNFFKVTPPSDQNIANSIVVSNNDSVIKLTGKEIINLLQKPMTDDSLKKLGVTIPVGSVASLVSFDKFETKNLFKISFNIYYNNVQKEGVQDFLNATPKNEEIANKIKVNKQDAVSDQNINKVNALLSTSPMTKEILDQLSITFPEGADVSKISFKNIITTNPLEIIFTINYNNVPKMKSDSLFVYATDAQIANSIKISNNDILKTFTVDKIKDILDTKPMTKEILNQLSINILSGIDPSKISFENLDISNDEKIIFVINYNNVPKFESDFFNSFSYQEVVNKIIVSDNIISNTSQEVKTLLETNPMTEEILNSLKISFPENIDVASITFTNVNIISLFEISFTINYKEVPKNSNNVLNVTPNDIDVVKEILPPKNQDELLKYDNGFIKKLLETNPMTKEILDQLSISIPKGSNPSKISFTNIDTSNKAKILFTVNYNGVSGSIFSIITTPAKTNTVLIASLAGGGSAVLIIIIGLIILFYKKKNGNNFPKEKKAPKQNNEFEGFVEQESKKPIKKEYEQNYKEYSNVFVMPTNNNPNKVLKPIINKPIKMDDEDNKWRDNKWYGDKSETGEWSNGNFLSNEEIDKIINDKSKNAFNSQSKNDSSIDDWDDIFKITEN